MNLALNTSLAQNYTSNSQIARVLTENWVKENSYCPSCGEVSLIDYENNRPVADFFCKKCNEDFELKSKGGKVSNSIADGAYETMIERINSKHNPNFFFLTYTKSWTVNDFLIIPKQFFTPEIIIKRNPLGPTARRAGWVGCNIDISKIPQSGKVFLVKNAQIIDSEKVQESFTKTTFLRNKTDDAKGWILDTLNCIESIKKNEFTLDEVYKFEESLKPKYPENNFIKAKLRQQLQVLRDKNIIEFMGRGKYRKVI
jgi:type II restriction enzyme